MQYMWEGVCRMLFVHNVDLCKDVRVEKTFSKRQHPVIGAW